jgi:acetyl esterase/lipase
MLQAAGVPVEFRLVAGSIHGFLRARFVSESARSEFDRLCEAIAEALVQTGPIR